MIKTKASIVKEQDAEKCFQAIKVEKLKKLPKTKPPQQSFGSKNKINDSDDDMIFGDGDIKNRRSNKKKEVTFDSARKEILNFGLSAKSQDEKSNQTEQLLIKLGAKPLKRMAKNYKEILEEKRKEKLKDSIVNKRTKYGTSASLQYQSQSKKKPARNNDGLLKRYGRVEKSDRNKFLPSLHMKKRNK